MAWVGNFPLMGHGWAARVGLFAPHVLSLARDLHQPIAADCSMVHILVSKAVLAQAPNHFHAPAPEK